MYHAIERWVYFSTTTTTTKKLVLCALCCLVFHISLHSFYVKSMDSFFFVMLFAFFYVHQKYYSDVIVCSERPSHNNHHNKVNQRPNRKHHTQVASASNIHLFFVLFINKIQLIFTSTCFKSSFSCILFSTFMLNVYLCIRFYAQCSSHSLSHFSIVIILSFQFIIKFMVRFIIRNS